MVMRYIRSRIYNVSVLDAAWKVIRRVPTLIRPDTHCWWVSWLLLLSTKSCHKTAAQKCCWGVHASISPRVNFTQGFPLCALRFPYWLHLLGHSGEVSKTSSFEHWWAALPLTEASSLPQPYRTGERSWPFHSTALILPCLGYCDTLASNGCHVQMNSATPCDSKIHHV